MNRTESQPGSDYGAFNVAERSSPDLTSNSPLAHNLLGATLADRYRIESVIGQGSMGTVYLGRDLFFGRLVAIKMLTWRLVSDPRSVRRFQREAEATSRLNHPNIISVFDVGVASTDQPYFVMEYVQGINLNQLLKQGEEISILRALQIGIQVCEALSHAHARGVIHRDLKPSNIMCVGGQENAFIKVVDFGVAKLIADPEGASCDTTHLTRCDEVIGTPAYMSPEQCLSRPLDERSDIYSLGVVLYQLLAGKPPLLGANTLETLGKHVMEPPPDFSFFGASNVPLDVQQIVFTCLRKAPEARYQTMQELCQDLKKVRESAIGEEDCVTTPVVDLAPQLLETGSLTPDEDYGIKLSDYLSSVSSSMRKENHKPPKLAPNSFQVTSARYTQTGLRPPTHYSSSKGALSQSDASCASERTHGVLSQSRVMHADGNYRETETNRASRRRKIALVFAMSAGICLLAAAWAFIMSQNSSEKITILQARTEGDGAFDARKHAGRLILPGGKSVPQNVSVQSQSLLAHRHTARGSKTKVEQASPVFPSHSRPSREKTESLLWTASVSQPMISAQSVRTRSASGLSDTDESMVPRTAPAGMAAVVSSSKEEILSVRETELRSSSTDTKQSQRANIIELNNIGYAAMCQQHYPLAIRLFEDALKLDPTYKTAAINLCRAYNNYGLQLYESGNYYEAETAYKRGISFSEQMFGRHSSQLTVILQNYAGLLKATYRDDEANRIEERYSLLRAQR
ncbi:MAG TPA: serine/threonine-protein kinase [Candidatus Obscuribacterales bacterium]